MHIGFYFKCFQQRQEATAEDQVRNVFQTTFVASGAARGSSVSAEPPLSRQSSMSPSAAGLPTGISPSPLNG